MIPKYNFRHIPVILIIMALVLGIHLLLLHVFHITPASIIYISYTTHFIMASALTLFLVSLSHKHKHLTGFLFLGGSLLKFAVFFIFFYPYFLDDGKITKMETLYFMIPYLTGLVLETYFVVRMLNHYNPPPETME